MAHLSGGVIPCEDEHPITRQQLRVTAWHDHPFSTLNRNYYTVGRQGDITQAPAHRRIPGA